MDINLEMPEVVDQVVDCHDEPQPRQIIYNNADIITESMPTNTAVLSRTEQQQEYQPLTDAYQPQLPEAEALTFNQNAHRWPMTQGAVDGANCAGAPGVSILPNQEQPLHQKSANTDIFPGQGQNEVRQLLKGESSTI